MSKISAKSLTSKLRSHGSRQGQGMLVTAMAAILVTSLMASEVHDPNASGDVSGPFAQSERIVPPTAQCSNQSPASQFSVSTQPVRTAAVGPSSNVRLDTVAKRVVTAMNSATGIGKGTHRGVAITGKRLIVATKGASEGYKLNLIYPSDYVNVESWGPLRPMRFFDSQPSGRWFLTVPASVVGKFGDSGTLAVGEVYYDPNTIGSPVLCLVSVELNSKTEEAKFVGISTGDPKSSFLMIQSASTDKTCKTYGTETNGKYQGYVCPAEMQVTTELKGTASHSITKKKNGKKTTYTNSITVTVGFQESSAYIYCKTNAICTELGSQLTPNNYKKYSEYESTRNQYWINPKIDLTVAHTTAWDTTRSLDKKSTEWNAPLPWCAALAGFLNCTLDLDLSVGMELAFSGKGTLTIWGNRPAVNVRSKKYTLKKNGKKYADEPTIELGVGGPYSSPQLGGEIAVTVKAPIITMSVGLRIATIGDLLWAEGGIEGSVWNEISVSTAESDPYIGSCGSLEAVAEAGAKIPFTDIEETADLRVSLLEACTD